MIHRPVMVEESMKYLALQKNGTYIDATLGAGGHSRAMLKHVGSRGTVLGIERDHELAKRMTREHVNKLIVEEGNYTDMKKFASRHKLNSISGVLFDLGLSSWHLEESRRGFSFQRDEVLDMRYSTSDDTRAAELVNTLSEKELADLFYTYGEERFSRKIAHAIVSARKSKRIIGTQELVEIISGVVKSRGKTHPATRVFQALRIAVNRELDAVREGIREAMRIVVPGGRVVAISYHSLEDRIIKDAFGEYGNVLTKKPVTPSYEEIAENSRARSAKLRAWENI